jgi:predicted aspartyl protease
MKTRSAPAIFLVMLSLVEATPSATDEFDQLKLRLRDGYQVIVQGAIGPLEGLNLLIDTGSVPSVVDDRIARRLRLEIGKAETMVFDRKIRTFSATLSKVRVGPIVAETVLASVGDLSYLGGQDIDAIVGLDVLTRSSFTIDYERRVITFGSIAAGDPSVHLDVTPPLLTIQVSFGGQPCRLLVDTGSRNIVLFEQRVSERLSHLRVRGDKLLYHMAGTSRLQRVVLPRLDAGSLTITGVEGLLSNADVDQYPSSIDGILGVRAIASRRVDFDFERSSLGLR